MDSVALKIWGMELAGNGTLGICAVVLIVGALLVAWRLQNTAPPRQHECENDDRDDRRNSKRTKF
jgi:hypothetical protein